MKKSIEFAVFILTHGRPNDVLTLSSLRRHGYTGKIYIIIDNEDATEKEYRENFGDAVHVFDKKAIAETFDEADNFKKDRRSIVYARNYCFQFAKENNIKYFMQLDDDYRAWSYRFNKDLVYWYSAVKNLDAVFDILLKFYKSINCTSLAIMQGGDFFGGIKGEKAESVKLYRKCMNTFICSTERPFTFVGRINEDVNTYVNRGKMGDLFFSTNLVSISQTQTQKTNGGMTEMYLDNGTYVKSFYTILYNPSSVKIGVMGVTFQRYHHKVFWNNTVPKIIRQEHRKNKEEKL
jgi:hypothetical protein